MKEVFTLRAFCASVIFYSESIFFLVKRFLLADTREKAEKRNKNEIDIFQPWLTFLSQYRGFRLLPAFISDRRTM